MVISTVYGIFSMGDGWPDNLQLCAFRTALAQPLSRGFPLLQQHCWYSTKTDCCSLTSNRQPEEEIFKLAPLSPNEPCYAVVRPFKWSKQEDVDCRCVCQSIACYREPELWSWCRLHMENNHGKRNHEVPAKISRSDGCKPSRQSETIQADTLWHRDKCLCACGMLNIMHSM